MNPFQVLKIDAQHRYSGVDNDLFTLPELNLNHDWDYSLPTIIKTDQSKKRASSMKILRDVKDFSKSFMKQYPMFQEFNFNNVCIAGGCVSELIRGKTDGSGDVDMFIYGLNGKGEEIKKAANSRVRSIINNMITSYEKHLRNQVEEKSNGQYVGKKPIETPHYELQFIRNRSCISIIFNHFTTIQIILRHYSSISEILHGFDLGSSAVGYNGNQVYFTTLSKFAYEMMCNIIDTTRRSLTYERRLEKYFNRGFDIILPNLNMDDVKTHYLQYNMKELCELPFFPFSYHRRDGNKIFVSSFHMDSNVVKANHKFLSNPNVLGQQSHETERKSMSDYQISDLDEFKVLPLNLYNLIHGKSDLYYLNSQHNLDILDKGPHITRGKIINFYDSLRRRVYRQGRLTISSLRQYITVTPISEIMTNLFPNESIPNPVSTGAYLKELFEKQKTYALAKYEAIDSQNHADLPWILENPGAQLSGSFNPVIAEPQKWYGSYFINDENQVVQMTKSSGKSKEANHAVEGTDNEIHDDDNIGNMDDEDSNEASGNDNDSNIDNSNDDEDGEDGEDDGSD